MPGFPFNKAKVKWEENLHTRLQEKKSTLRITLKLLFNSAHVPNEKKNYGSNGDELLWKVYVGIS